MEEPKEDRVKTTEDEKAAEKVSFSQVEVDGNKTLKCDNCEKTFDKEPAMKRHITKMHTKVAKTKTQKRKGDEETNEEEEEERRKTLTARMMERYGGE